MQKNKTARVLLIGSFLLVGCKRNPVDRLRDPYPGGSVPLTSGVFTIYKDELKTGGGFGFIPTGENQTIDSADTSSPRLTARSIKYSWNGQDVLHTTDTVANHAFAGFSLCVSPDLATVNSTPGKNLMAPSYTTLKLFVRGSLSSDTRLRIEGPGDNVLTPARTELTSLSSDWQEVSLPIPTASDFSDVKIFLTISFQYSQPSGTTTPGEGGVVYLDDIRYVQ